MHAVRVQTPGGPEALVLQELPTPAPGAGEVLIRIAAAGLNRTDVLQRKGRANLPPGATDVLGLEVSGHIEALGAGVTGVAVGDAVVALTDSGGYATHLVVPRAQVAPVPHGLDLVAAAGLPEIAATVVSNVLMTGRYALGESVLIHGATGGVGSFAIQLLKALGATVFATAGTDEKCETARNLGADVAINYRTESFAEVVQNHGGADIILDTVAGPYLEANLEALKTHGRMITIGKQGGASGTLDFTALMKKKATISGSLLRDRTAEEKAGIMARTVSVVWPLIESGGISVVVDSVFPLAEVSAAHEYFDGGTHVGKVLLDSRGL